MGTSKDQSKGRVFANKQDLPDGFWTQISPFELPSRVLMCEPSEFDVVDVKNPFMKEQVGKVDRNRALKQWTSLVDAFEHNGMPVEVISPVSGCEDMVFTANPTLIGRSASGMGTVLLSQMRFSSRQREVGTYRLLFEANGYKVTTLPEGLAPFEGGGDAVWHPGRKLIWGGYGFRTSPEVYQEVSRIFGAPVMMLELKDDRFYHLDTCFAALDESTVLIYPKAFSDSSLELIHSGFMRVLECDADEAAKGLACNCVGLPKQKVILPSGNPKTEAQLKAIGYQVVNVDLGEFHKSGGSAYCLKQWVFD